MSKRLYFGNIKEVIEPPNLIEIQLQSYFDFLQQDTPAAARKNIGLQGVLKEIFPIKSYDENIELDFVSYDIEQPKMSDYEAIRAEKPTAPPFRSPSSSNPTTSPRKKRSIWENSP